MNFIVLLSLTLGFTVIYAALNSRRRKSQRLPPGPAPMPIVGNVKDLPPSGKQDWVHWLKHKCTYGPISSITVLGQTIVIVNNSKIALDLLTKRSSIYSSRPRMTFASEMVGWENGLAFQGIRPCKKWKPADFFSACCKILQIFCSMSKRVFHPESKLLYDRSPDTDHSEAGAVILNIAYGYRVEPFGRDHLVHITNEALDEFGKATVPGAWLVDIIPALKYVPSWFPGAGFKRTAKLWREHLVGIADRPYEFVKQQIESGKYTPSYLGDMLKDGFPEPGSEKELVAKWTSASLYTGGADTTVSSINCFFLAMALFPDVQRKAQEEIERVVGQNRLPNVTDRANLPYINAVVKEVLRWHPVAPMGLPHMSSVDDNYDNYFIPKDSIILPNIWAMMHDPDVYPDPMEFQPDRFLGEYPAPDPKVIAFGFGRRVCPGRFLADKTVFLTVAQSLAVFDISKPVQSGVGVTTPHFDPGVISHPSPFQCEIKPRTPELEALILTGSLFSSVWTLDETSLVVDGEWGDCTLLFPFAVYEAKKNQSSEITVRMQLKLAFNAYPQMLDKLVRQPGKMDEYHSPSSAAFPIFGFTFSGSTWRINVGYLPNYVTDDSEDDPLFDEDSVGTESTLLQRTNSADNPPLAYETDLVGQFFLSPGCWGASSYGRPNL
ncbi:hypothetical protein N7508_007680 [Penicillium antarcticum]|uniref:uncharacterized protein n=1 Tax=Penicillium antarcticum TaxID=416450 RepID=UPI00238BDB58|nr:uncharacterized protein N7508_007680 [Penicillium antarcticum]KAJ5297431.1 hypothetical protein N7508_007680 [Penicillium antarcticum]